MPVPTSITDLSTTAASNSPAGADAVFPNLDDYLRAHAAFIAQLNAADATKVAKAGDTMTGPLVLNADPSAALGAATKGYVDTGLATKAASSHAHAWSAITDRNVSEGTSTQDPNSAAYPVILTNHANSPDSSYYWHITTTYYSTSGNVAQIAVQYSGSNRVYARSKYSETWTAWVRCDLGEGLTRSIGTNGYATIPGTGGLIKQWGKFTRTSGAHSVTFPMTFPNACLSVVQSDMYAAQLNDSSRVTAVTNSGFTSSRGDSTSFDVMFQAIGY